MPQTIETQKQFDDTPTGWAQRWGVEMKASEDDTKDWKDKGGKIEKRFLDDREGQDWTGGTRINLFSANVQTLRALLYGKTPKVDVERRFFDPNDDVARVGGEILQRLLNTDVERDSDTYAEALENSLSDRLLPGLGVARCRYTAEFEQEEVPPITRLNPLTGEPVELAPAYTKEVKSYEYVDTDYVHWRDFRWSPCRTWDEVRWVAFLAPMTRDQLEKRFPKHAKFIPMKSNRDTSTTNASPEEKNQPWQRAEVWEIWFKENRKVYWWVKGYDQILDVKDDTLGLEGFWPVPRPMFANLTTSRLLPTPDFILAQDIYNEVDSVSTRITLLERAIAARGVYDQTSEEIKRVLSEAVANELIGVANFAMFKEKGGLAAVIDWLPLEMFVNALDVLRGYRSELMQLLYQVTGMSDIMRGQASQGATATEQALKAKFASVRVQEFQNEFARFASDIQSIKAEIISKHYDVECIVRGSNAQFMSGADQGLIEQAIALIKSDFYKYRIVVKPESVAMADMAAVKQERAEFLTATATFMQAIQPIVQGAPWSAPYLLQMLQWSAAGFRDSSTIEGVLDQMVNAANQAQQQAMIAAQQPQPPDPKVEALRAKAQVDMQKGQIDIQSKMIDAKAKVQEKMLDARVHAQKAHIDMVKNAQESAQSAADHEMSMEKIENEMKKDAMETVEKT